MRILSYVVAEITVAAGAVAGAAWAVRGRSSAVFGPSIWHGDRGRRAVALTFDDGPSESTPEILQILDKYKVKATFFQCGANAERLPEIARMVSSAGHEIGNHTYSHAALWLRPPSFVRKEVERGQLALEQVHGLKPHWFRAPYGVRWFGMRHVNSVMWTTIARDWVLPSEKIVQRLQAGAANGAIYCLHDGRLLTAAPDIQETLIAVRKIVPWLLDKGFSLETIKPATL